MTEPFIHCLLPLNEANETACIKSMMWAPDNSITPNCVFPFFAFAIISLSAWFILCFLCHYFWHFSWIAFICQMQVASSFGALLQFHCLCHFRLCYLSSLSTLDSFLNKSIVIYLWYVNKWSCLQLWFYNSVVAFWINEALKIQAGQHCLQLSSSFHPITALP